ncbi:unnamed protein product [Thlaspi arvense]|uniref:Uncharacterized protein n=1 Tax=Thlaspi arvense TaxID=13288 RepID=A0AAU9T5S4_THLAR|nr:unnamed protein product [Thlaspi arvense]
MDGGGARVERRRSIKERLGLKGSRGRGSDSAGNGQDRRTWLLRRSSGGVAGMNLAAALAAERHFRAAQDTVGSGSPPAVRGTPVRVSLMMLLEETDGADDLGADSTCCVCMERKRAQRSYRAGTHFAGCARGSCG